MSKLARVIVPFVIGGCATAGATLRSGVGDRMLDHPPYYAGSGTAGVAQVAYLPVHFQPGASQSPVFDPPTTAGSAVRALITDMNAVLDSLGRSASWLAAPRAPAGTAPDVYFGCALDPSGDCVERGDSVLGRQGTTMHLALRRPSPEWIGEAQRIADSAGATHTLLVTLEVGQYWLRQSGLLGKKSVELGTGYTVPVEWLTSLETPVSVLQLTAVLIGRDGRGVRIGAEGIAAQRTPLVVSAMGGQRMIANEDVERARTLRRTDLPERPLAWRTALCRLVSEVTQQPVCQ